MNELFGLPAHPLLVHAAVVLVPMAAVGVVLIAVVPGWRARFGIVVFAIAVAGAVFAFVAKESGEALEDSVQETDILRQHAALGDAALWFALPLVVVAGVLWWLGWRAKRSTTDGSSSEPTSTSTASATVRPRPLAPWLNVVIAIVAIAVAGWSTVQFIQIGHLGAEATWSNVKVTNGGGEDGDGDGD